MRESICKTCEELPLYLNIEMVAKVLGISPGEFAVYSYLLYREDRKTYRCWPSRKTIGSATRMGINTVRKHIWLAIRRSLCHSQRVQLPIGLRNDHCRDQESQNI